MKINQDLFLNISKWANIYIYIYVIVYIIKYINRKRERGEISPQVKCCENIGRDGFEWYSRKHY